VVDCTYEQPKSALKASSADRIPAFVGCGSSRSSGWGTSSRGLDGLGRRPVPGQQLGQTRPRPSLAIRSMTSAKYACGLSPLSRADSTIVYMCAARSPPSSLPRMLRRWAAANSFAKAEEVEASVMQKYADAFGTKNVKKWVKRQYGAQSSERCNGAQK
jgi:hypothetical protein